VASHGGTKPQRAQRKFRKRLKQKTERKRKNVASHGGTKAQRAQRKFRKRLKQKTERKRKIGLTRRHKGSKSTKKI
jgi:hypothetical protein